MLYFGFCFKKINLELLEWYNLFSLFIVRKTFREREEVEIVMILVFCCCWIVNHLKVVPEKKWRILDFTAIAAERKTIN